jgi:hypothetical protein
MLYSSSKANVSELLSTGNGTISAKVNSYHILCHLCKIQFEINVADDLSETNVLDVLHPKKEEKKQAFSKPSRPGKGGARLVK